MANPIIKIKRGTGTPLAWNGTIGITAGEFALETNTGVLYMGMSGSGGFSGFFEDAVQPRISSTIKSVIPIGYQISNDSTFGGNSPTTVGNTETWNGTSWTEVNDLNTARRLLAWV